MEPGAGGMVVAKLRDESEWTGRGAIALREFDDARGRRWQVWKVVPKFTLPRSGVERRVAIVDSFVNDRRRTNERRGPLPPPWIHGGLCFQCVKEKRRLTPVPVRWEESSPEELEQHRRRAVKIPRTV